VQIGYQKEVKVLADFNVDLEIWYVLDISR
jgi:hypothetical protein